jgi:hypothetical protein
MQRLQTNFINTRSIDVAAFIIAVSKQDCTISFAGGAIGTFSFESNSSTRDALISYETGGMVEGKLLFESRNQLFRRIRGGGK